MLKISKSGLALFFISLGAMAQQPVADVLVRRLSTCDGAFFRTLKELGPAAATASPLEYKGGIAYWKVLDRGAEQKNIKMFSQPLSGKIKLLGYIDEVADLGEWGLYYSWGFLAEGNPETVAAAVKPLIEDGARLRKDGDVYVRSEINYSAGPNWVKNDGLKGGAIPARGTIERVFLVEDGGEHPGATRVTCSLQGAVTPPVLDAVRPDLAAVSPASDRPADEASVRRLFAVMNPGNVIDEVLAQALAVIKPSITQSLAGRKLTPEQEAVMGEMQGKILALLQEELQWEKLEPVYMKVYLKTFTQEEIDGLIAFYQTKAGQATIKKLPAAMKTTTLLMQERARALMPKILQIGIESIQKMKQVSLPRRES